MGRQSPGKWIRNLLLGKKSSSKSKSSREKDIYKPSSTKDVLAVSSETSMSSSISGANAIKGKLSEKEVISVSSNDGIILTTEDEHANGQSHDNFYSEDRNEKSRLIKTAIITIQAAIRGYQARGTYKTVKDIIPLQAYIRGQLVRRQAISALYCVKSIVRFQALARGYKVRHSDIGLAVQKLLKDTKFSKSTGVVTSTQAVKLSDKTFAHKLLASSPYAVSPRLKYNTGEPNLVWEWLGRWTKSHFWVPLQEAQRSDSVSDKKNGSSQTVETNKGQVKKNARKGTPHDLVSDSNKHKRYPKKDSNPALHSAKEHPPKELEKRSSKKSQIQNVSDKSEASDEKRRLMVRKVSDHTKVNDVPEEDAGASSEKMKYLAVSKSEECDLGKSLIQQAQEHDNNEPCNGTNSPLQPSLMNSKDGGVIEELNDVKSKNFQRRASLPANFTDLENVLHDNTPRLPSYMAPTESTKAKLRGQCSPRSVSDLADVSRITRRLSLSSSLSVKLGSFSPRSDRLAALTNKIRTDRSLSSSRDGTHKLNQPQWRR
ncbi:Protein IQ-DOMAIN 31 [Vigna angularis]|uniref:Protein IQ-DOMAIN 31 n=1 Tax=Phaseolus angularis TaxID=3914 RepID=A0A8T0LFJ1_PHAAN|nr:protein IQ-DOMAIN 28 [Vigna angularis]XP_017424011.1 protein IQ-DOMAIN 28 [Vigna angularis]XP_017424020.1 protein IQ-DOMAIN 28 [Vigna angularis]XP_017424026.1 protein IQ-DOMAIN 28 [Vigna angularis]KAG2409488.1 Protein IQ-DOMAIN 31 [Vigna angularis]